MSKIKQKRYYIDRTESDKIIFVTTGRKNRMVHAPAMRSVELVKRKEDSNVFQFPKVEFQDDHSCSGYNVDYCDIEEHKLPLVLAKMCEKC